MGRMELVSRIRGRLDNNFQDWILIRACTSGDHPVPSYNWNTDKEYAGHDITLAIGLMKTDAQWLDRFVKMEEKWINDAKGWVEYMDAKYPRCAKLDKWDEDQESWPELSEEEKEAINKCVIM